MRLLIALLFVGLFAGNASAATRWTRHRTTHVTKSSSSVSFSGGPQDVASAKASRMASNGVLRHLGGGYGGANAEGIGFSTRSASDALNNCCFTGQKKVAGSSVVRGKSGWYACKIYW
jgi:hypothetical protein